MELIKLLYSSEWQIVLGFFFSPSSCHQYVLTENGADMHGSSFRWSEVFCLCGWWFTYVRRRPLLLIGCNYLFPLIPAGTSMWAMAYWTENRKRPFIIHVVPAVSHPPSLAASHFPHTPPQPSVCISINNGAFDVENGIVRRQHNGGEMRGFI